MCFPILIKVALFVFEKFVKSAVEGTQMVSNKEFLKNVLFKVSIKNSKYLCITKVNMKTFERNDASKFYFLQKFE